MYVRIYFKSGKVVELNNVNRTSDGSYHNIEMDTYFKCDTSEVLYKFTSKKNFRGDVEGAYTEKFVLKSPLTSVTMIDNTDGDNGTCL